jgi:hypothetical protein
MRNAPAWAAAPLSPEKFDRNAIEIPRYAAIERQFSADAQDLVAAHGRGEISSSDLRARFNLELGSTSSL